MSAVEPMPGYPHHLAGDPAPPPEPVAPRTFELAVRARERAAILEPDVSEVLAATPWRMAVSLEVLLAEANAAAPTRSKRSDGGIGDAAHLKLGRGTDHAPWLVHQGTGVVRARDITNDPVLELPAVFERIRAAAAAGRLPQVLNGGYLILNQRITAEDWSGWRTYTGSNPHVSHGHASVSLNPVQFDSRAGWGVFAPAAAPAPVAPSPAPPVPSGPGWTGPDLTGRGLTLRGQAAGQPPGPQSNGARVRGLQRWLRDTYPLYAKRLVDDGWYGTETGRVLAEFARRSGVRGADGLNVGPQLAAALYRAGFERGLSAPRLRAAAHRARGRR